MIKYIYLKGMYSFYYIAILMARKWNKDRKKNSEISKKFINWNNKRILKQAIKKNVKSNEVAILLPHCIQLYTCPHKITSDINNCKNCGLCKIGNILELHKKYKIKVKVATGGTLARLFIKEEKPKLVLAVACERDLVSGIYDAFPMPVYGVFNKILNGPCINTDVAMSDIENILKSLN